MHNCRSTRQQRLQKEEITEIVATMNHCRSAPLRVMAAIHNPHTTQKITDSKQVVCRVVTITSSLSLIKYDERLCKTYMYIPVTVFLGHRSQRLQ